MLVISRHVNEGIWIGETHIKLLSIKGRTIRLGIEAPLTTIVSRDELSPLTIDEVQDLTTSLMKGKTDAEHKGG